MSLKTLTRNQDTKGKQVHFKLTTNTEIDKSKHRCSCHKDRKMLLSHTKTKVTLTQILAKTAEARFKASTSASYTIIYGEKIVSNMDIVEDYSYTQEEADTLMIRLVNIISSPESRYRCVCLAPFFCSHRSSSAKG